MLIGFLRLFLLTVLLAFPALGQTGEVDAQRAAVAQARVALDARDRDAAMAALTRAVDAGFSGVAQLIEDPAFTELRIAPGMNTLLERSAAQRPRPVVTRPADQAELTLSPGDLVWDAETKRFEVTADLSAAERLPLLSAEDIGNKIGPDHRYLQSLYEAGKSCGLGGVLYDNRDRGHSWFDHRVFPQLSRSVYEAPLKDRKLDYGMANSLRFSVPTFGNSSTMYRGPQGRSLPRRAMTYKGQAAQSFANYAANHVYVFPGGSDPFPANWPYSFASRGMSGSDQWIVQAVAMIMAALPCDVRAFAEAQGLIAPTVQMVFRRAQAGVGSRAAYMSGAAHPMIFDDSAANLHAMIDLAASLRVGDLPPMVRLEVEEDSFSPRAGLAEQSEILFDTPSAIARVWHGFAGQHRMVLSAAPTKDPNGRPLELSWVLLRGDPNRVRITPLGPDKAEIVIDWHDKITLHPEQVARVDIGVFAHNGAHDSAPGFVSVLFPAHQKRRYARGPGGVPRLVSIDYSPERRFDPILFWRADWQDIFGYDDTGKLVGWMRQTADGRDRFAASGQPADGRSVAYRIGQSGEDLPILEAIKKP